MWMVPTPPSAAPMTVEFSSDFYGGDEVEVIADGGFVGADLGPFIADEVDALGGLEGGFNVGDDGRILRGRV